MLGGSFWIAVIRNSIGALLLMSVFLMLDRPRAGIKKTVGYYGIYGSFLILVFSIWYLADRSGYIRFSGLAALPCTGIFCILLSSDGIFLSLYKVSIGFYMLSLCVVTGVDGSRLAAGGNLWVDIQLRIAMCTIMLVFIWKRFRRKFLEHLDFLQEEMDRFSLISLMASVLLAALSAYWPTEIREFSVTGMIRILVIMFMAGVIQYSIFHLYIHLGKEHHYQAEKELLETNERFLRLQLELADESKARAAGIRHDVRHHCLLLREYVQKGDTERALAYLNQYLDDIEGREEKQVCGNQAVNSILSAYARYAEMKGIRVTLGVTAAGELQVRDIDLVAILANVFENAIHGCINAGAAEPEIVVMMNQKGHKMVIQCRNTCAAYADVYHVIPEPDESYKHGIYSIMRTASRYDGETDFVIENGMFEARILLDLSVSRG